MVGGGIGAALRFHLGRWIGSFNIWGVLPAGTFIANVIGGLFMGILMALLMRGSGEITPYMENYRSLLGVGLLGGFTTFSSFSLEMAMMIEGGEWVSAFLYAVASVVIALLALFIGMYLTRLAL